MTQAKGDEGVPAQVAEIAAEIRHVAGRLKRRMREQSNVGEMPDSQIAVLLHLEKAEPATVSELARAEGMRPQSMGAIVAALEAAGHVQGAPDPQDGRRTRLSLTPACRAWMQAGRDARQDWLARTIATRLSPPEQARLAEALTLLARLIE